MQAPAKINLFLHVTGRRSDGYHLLESLAVFAEACDLLEMRPQKASGEITKDGALPADHLNTTGPFSAFLDSAHNTAPNLVLQALQSVRKWLKKRNSVLPAFSLHLEKFLPVASGIGGGSADAAAALRLCLAWIHEIMPSLAPNQAELEEMAAALGMDVPVCLRSAPAFMQGAGEILKAAPPMPECGMVLLNPGVSVKTPAIFKRLAKKGNGFSPSLPPLPEKGWRSPRVLADFLKTTRNDLQTPAIEEAPLIKGALSALHALPDALLSRMSGSGATCFALFETPERARQAAEQLKENPSIPHSWWISGGAMRNAPPEFQKV